MTAVTAKENWYALYTAPRAEKQVVQRIQRLGLTGWLPLHRSPRVWSDRVKLVEIPLFPSYVFVHCPENKLYELLQLPGIVRILFHDQKPAVIQEREIKAIRLFLEQAANHVLTEGEEVEILCGALRHISGKIRTIKRKYLLLYIEQLRATVCVNLQDVAPVRRIK